MNTNVDLKKTARLAGLLFFLWIVSGFYDMFFVAPKIFVTGDIPGSAQNILKHEILFRTSIFSGLITSALWLLLVCVFYHLFKSVNERYARLLVAFVVVQIPIAFIKTGHSIATILILRNDMARSCRCVKSNDFRISPFRVSIVAILRPVLINARGICTTTKTTRSLAYRSFTDLNK